MKGRNVLHLSNAEMLSAMQNYVDDLCGYRSPGRVTHVETKIENRDRIFVVMIDEVPECKNASS